MSTQTLNQMAVTASAAVEIQRFLDTYNAKADLKALTGLDELNAILKELQSPLTGAVIPLEQATRPPKILVDSGVTQAGVPWRTLQCPGGPLVLQMICEKVDFALWIQEC